jgi:hypothetical protein
LSQRRLPRRIRTASHFIKFQDSCGLQNLLNASRVVDAGQLHQQLRFGVAAALLH